MRVLDYPGSAWSPYVVGAAIGVLSWLTFYFSDHPIGASSFYAHIAGFLGKLVAPNHTKSLAYFQTTPPRVSWEFVFMSKTGPLFVVIFGTTIVLAFGLGETGGVNIVGEIPSGLPKFGFPALGVAEFLPLIPLALTVSFVGFLESVSVAKTLASKRRQKVESNKELIALGAANLAAGVTGAYPVTGGFSRSAVNFSAGASTGLASLFTAALIALSVRLWHYNKADAVALILTFVAVIAVGITKGILIGVISTIILYLWRTSRPHMAVVGQVPNTSYFRNVKRHEVQTLPHVLLLRIDESLYFANANILRTSCFPPSPIGPNCAILC